MSRPPITSFAQIVADEVYTVRDVATLMKRREETVIDWIQNDKLPALPRLSEKARYRILGSVILAHLGGFVPAPAAGETPEQRSKRAAANREAIRRLAKTPRIPA